MIRSIARRGFTLSAWSYPVALGAQIFFAGLYVFAGPSNIELHRNGAHVIGALTLLLVATAHLGAIGRSDRLMAWGVAGLLAIQGGLVHVHQIFDAPVIAALHPVNAMILFWVSLTLARRARAYWNAESTPPATRGVAVREPAAP